MVLGVHIWLRVTEPDFLEKILIGQKWPKDGVFGLFKKIEQILPLILEIRPRSDIKKIMSLVSSGFWVKRKFLWFTDILRKLHVWEISGSQVIAKNCSRPMKFQYSLIVNISVIDKYLTLIFGM